MIRLLPLTLFLLSAAALAPAQDSDPVRANYTKREAEIPMRDGRKLFTAIYAPKDASKEYPILLTRTPYSVAPYGGDKFKTSLGPSAAFLKEGFIFVYQDVRGRNLSEGDFVNVRPHRPAKSGTEEVDESSDTYDSIDWLVKNVANNNGKVGIFGVSYDGLTAAITLLRPHPALKAISEQTSPADQWMNDDDHRYGALRESYEFE